MVCRECSFSFCYYDAFFYYGLLVMKTRTYYKCKSSIETHVYDGVKLVAHLVYYPANGYTYPRYHFENWCLLHKELNYEICRFMRFVEKVLANPRMDLDSVYVDSSLESFWRD